MEAVPQHEHVGDLEAHVADGLGEDAPGGPVEQGADVDPTRPEGLEVAHEVAHGEAGVDEVLHQDDVASGEIEVSAPGGDYYDSPGGTPTTSPSNLILSAAPLHVLQAAGDVDADGDITAQGEGFVMKDCRTVPGRGEQCGYYQYLQGTSMASPHAAGVAALIVSAHGKVEGTKGFTLAPDTTARILMDSARDKACPAGSPARCAVTRSGTSWLAHGGSATCSSL